MYYINNSHLKKWCVVIIITSVLLLLIFGMYLLCRFIKGEVPQDLETQRLLYSRRNPPEGTLHKDILYSKRLFNRQELDIYMPLGISDSSAIGKIPAIVFVPGSSWMHSCKEDVLIIDRFMEKMRRKGWAVISINYTCSPFKLLRGPEENVYKAFEWIHKHAQEYGIDPWDMGLYSVSTGSQLAMEAMIKSGDAGSLWRFWITEYAPVDLRSIENSKAFEFAGKFHHLSEKYLQKHSPVLHIEGTFPPTMIIYGNNSLSMELEQPENLSEMLASKGSKVRLLALHRSESIFSQAEQEKKETQALAFMERFFRE